MRGSPDSLNQIRRLRRALEALSADLDAIEKRPHLMLRSAAENLGQNDSRESFVDHFAFAVRSATAR